MTNLLEQKKKMTWYNQDKANELAFDESDWNETCKILDDPNIDQATKDKALDDYISLMFHKLGVEGY